MSNFQNLLINQNFFIFSGPYLSNFRKFHHNQNFSFLQAWNCQISRIFTTIKISHFFEVRTRQISGIFTHIKISHFCRSGPVKFPEFSQKSKCFIFAGADLLNLKQFHQNQNFHFAGPYRSNFVKLHENHTFSGWKVLTCQTLVKLTTIPNLTYNICKVAANIQAQLISLHEYHELHETFIKDWEECSP